MTESGHEQKPVDEPGLLLRRRSFLVRGAAAVAVLGLGGLTVTQCTGYALPAGVDLRTLSTKEFLVLEAAFRRILAGLDEDAPRDAALFADGYLGRQEAWVVSDVRLLIHAFEHSPPALLGALSRFTRLDPARQDRYLHAWRRSVLAPMQQGFMALKGLAFMGAYRRARTLRAIGYDGPGA
jgi:hypothetical protein